MPPRVPPQDGLDAIDCSSNESNSNRFIFANSTDSEYDTTEDPIVFSQKHLNNQIGNLCLSKEKAELLASRLKEENMIEKVRQQGFLSAFIVEGPLCYCHDIAELF